jgi:hypothetical protein
MPAPPKTGIPIVDTAVATAVELAVERARAERVDQEAAARVAAESAGPARLPKTTRSLGSVTRAAIEARTTVLYEALGTSGFPNSPTDMARAIAAIASQLQLVPPDAPLNPESRPVREVAECFMRGVDRGRDREEQKEQREKPPEPAGTRRTGPTKAA